MRPNGTNAVLLSIAIFLFSNASAEDSREKAAPSLGEQEMAARLKKECMEAQSVRGENSWIRKQYPGAKVVSQALTPWMEGRRYDLLVVEKSDGVRVNLCFDITASFK
jgi:hypothetical protein